ncbi:hypothetical protein KKA00_05240 [bacterium]|nr:hypothetical protein [bacterium]
MKRSALCLLIMVMLAVTIFGCQRSPAPEMLVEDQWFAGYPLLEIYTRAYSPEGTFKALEEDLPELQRAGLNNLWLMPIHPIGDAGRKGEMGCPYSVKDYFEAAEEYGTMEDFASLVNAAHDLGMRVIIDMVINHSANDHVEMENHPDWYFHDSTGTFSREVADWWDVTDWNFDNHEVWDYLEAALLYWVMDYNVDGYRCDVAGMVPDGFWQRVIPNVREIKPDFYMLAEWDTPQMAVNGFNSDYDWTLYHKMAAHRNSEASLEDVWSAVEKYQNDYPQDFFPLRFIENHDQERAYAVFGDTYRAYASLIFTLPGIPLIYNGQEIGADHKPSLFEREPIDWEAGDEKILKTYQRLIDMRNKTEVLRTGALERYLLPEGTECLAFYRTSASDTAFVLINFSGEEVKIELPEAVASEYYIWGRKTDAPATETLPSCGYQVYLKK